MTMNKKMHDALNDQINAEMFSAYLYLAMSAWCETQNLEGAAIWMMSQAQEEMVHAMKFYNHILERGSDIELKAIEKPQKKWKSLLEVFEASLEHEKYITDRIHKLVTLSNETKDYASAGMLQWFVDEQVEEEDNVTRVLEKLKMVKDAPAGLFMIDKELATRPLLYTMPVAK